MDGIDHVPTDDHHGIPMTTLVSDDNYTITVVMSDLSTSEQQSEGPADEHTKNNNLTNQVSKQDKFDHSLKHDILDNGNDTLSSKVCLDSVERLYLDQNEGNSHGLNDVGLSKHVDCFDTIADKWLKHEDNVNNQSQSGTNDEENSCKKDNTSLCGGNLLQQHISEAHNAMDCNEKREPVIQYSWNFQCGRCNTTLSNAYNLKRHISEIHEGVKYYAKGKPDQPYSAPLEKTFDNEPKKDKSVHQIKEDCFGDENKVVSKNEFGMKRTRKKTKQRKFKCEKCSATLSCDYNLRRHISEVHNGVKYYTKRKPFEKNIASPKKTSDDHIEKEEMILEFDKEEEEICSDQGTLLPKSVLENKINTETKHTQFECDICNAVLSCDYNLKRHISEVHNRVKYYTKRKPYKRNIIKPMKALDDHSKQDEMLHKFDQEEEISNDQDEPLLKSVSSNKTNQKTKQTTFKCEICNASLSCDYNLKRHISEIHKGIKYHTKRKQYVGKSVISNKFLEDQEENSKLVQGLKYEDEERFAVQDKVSLNEVFGQRSHKKIRYQKLKCEKCQLILIGSDYNLRRHMSEVHNGMTYYTTKKPIEHNIALTQTSSEQDDIYNELDATEKKPFNDQNKLLTKSLLISNPNKQREHKTFDCEICNKSLSCDSNLKRHMSEVHDGVKYYTKRNSCKDKIVFSEKTSDNQPEQEKIYVEFEAEQNKLFDDQSQVKLLSKSVLRNKTNKKMKHTGTTFECNICKASLSCDYNLKRHVSEVHKRVKYRAKRKSSSFSSAAPYSITIDNMSEKNIEEVTEFENTDVNISVNGNIKDDMFQKHEKLCYSGNQDISIEHENIEHDEFVLNQEAALSKKICSNDKGRIAPQLNKPLDQDSNTFEIQTPLNDVNDIKVESEKQEGLNKTALHSKQLKNALNDKQGYDNQRKMNKLRITCKYCGVTVKGKWYFERHLIEVHQCIRLHSRYRQAHNNKYGIDQQDDNNIKVAHVYPQAKRIKCSKCRIPFSSVQSLAYHIDEMHENDTSVKLGNKDLQSVTEKESEVRQNLQVSRRFRFSCSKCEKVFTRLSDINPHYRIAHVKKPKLQVFYHSCLRRARKGKVIGIFLCDICNTIHKTVGKLEKHAKEHIGTFSDNTGANKRAYPLEYSSDGHDTSNEDFAWDGLADKVDQRRRGHYYKCTFCQRKFSSHDKLQNHLSLHAGKTSYSCFACCKPFLCQKYLIHHMKKHVEEHVPKKIYECNECKKQFSSILFYERHINSNKHLSEGHLLCDICSKTYKTMDSFALHRRTHTQIAPEYTCNLCGAEFKRKYSLQRHHLSHSSVISYVCSVCSKTFKEKCLFTRHSLIHNPNRKCEFPCHLCPKSFFTNVQLNRHKRRVHMDERHFACSLCEKSFFNQGDLNIHLKTHTDKRSEICEICGKGFRLKAHLRAHLRMHQGEKRWGCEKCGVRYTDKRSYSRHIERCTSEKGKTLGS